MANQFWKRIKKSPGYKRIKLFLKRLTGKELRLKPDIHIHTVQMGGWWFHPDTLDNISVAYSPIARRLSVCATGHPSHPRTLDLAAAFVPRHVLRPLPCITKNCDA
jgi:hypothetical protein